MLVKIAHDNTIYYTSLDINKCSRWLKTMSLSNLHAGLTPGRIMIRIYGSSWQGARLLNKISIVDTNEKKLK